jgi:hypothetical protein
MLLHFKWESIFLPKTNSSFAEKHIFFAENVITLVKVYTFRPGKMFLGSTKKGLSFDTKLVRNPNPETGLPELD